MKRNKNAANEVIGAGNFILALRSNKFLNKNPEEEFMKGKLINGYKNARFFEQERRRGSKTVSVSYTVIATVTSEQKLTKRESRFCLQHAAEYARTDEQLLRIANSWS